MQDTTFEDARQAWHNQPWVFCHVWRFTDARGVRRPWCELVASDGKRILAGVKVPLRVSA